MKQLYLDIKERLQLEVTDLKDIRLFNNQFERSNNDNSDNNDEQAFPYPCAFIEFPEDNESISSSYKARRLNVLVRIYIGFESYALEDLEVFDLSEQVFKALDGWKASVSNEFNYVAQRMDYNHSNAYVYQFDFRTIYHDDSNYAKDKLVLKAAPTGTLKLTTNLDIDNTIIRTGDGL